MTSFRMLMRSLMLTTAILAFAPMRGLAVNLFTNPPGTADDLVIVEGTPSLLAGAQGSSVEATADGSGVQLAAGATAGTLRLKTISAKFPFNEAIPSWNGWASAGGGFRVWVTLASSTGHAASPVAVGAWGQVPDEAPRTVQFAEGIYQEDHFRVQPVFDRFDVQIEFHRTDVNQPSPIFRLMALSYSNSTGDARLAAWAAHNAGPGQPRAVAVRTAVTAPVPFRTVDVENKAIVSRICSPASVNMSLARFGVNVPTQSLAELLYDPGCDAFGVWHRSIQGAAQMGIRGYVRRFRDWESVRDALRQGAVVCASIRFEPGEVADPLTQFGLRREGTKGHIIVIKGVLPGGKVMVQDPASKVHGPDSVWLQDELAKAWFDKGGVAYVFTRPTTGLKRFGRMFAAAK